MHVRSLGFGQVPVYEELKVRLTRLQSLVRATTDPRTKLEHLTSLLNVIGQMASHAPTPELTTRLMTQYRSLTAGVASLRAQLTERPPSSFMLTLDRFSDQAISLGTETVKIVGTAARGVATVLPVVLLGLLAVAGLVAYGYTKHGGVRIRKT